MKTICCISVIAIASLCISDEASAQNIVNLNINNASLAVATTPSVLQFNFEDVNEFLQPKPINNAIHLTLMLRQQACNVTAMLNYTSSPGQPPADWVSTKFINCTYNNNGSPCNAQVNANDVVLTPNVNVPLFTQPAFTPTNNQYHYYTFNYDLKLNPRTTFVVPGTYNFSITYTMTAL